MAFEPGECLKCSDDRNYPVRMKIKHGGGQIGLYWIDDLCDECLVVMRDKLNARRHAESLRQQRLDIEEASRLRFDPIILDARTRAAAPARVDVSAVDTEDGTVDELEAMRGLTSEQRMEIMRRRRGLSPSL